MLSMWNNVCSASRAKQQLQCAYFFVCVSVRCVTDSDIIKTVCFRDGFLGFVYSPTKEISSSNDFMIKPWCRSAH